METNITSTITNKKQIKWADNKDEQGIDDKKEIKGKRLPFSSIFTFFWDCIAYKKPIACNF